MKTVVIDFTKATYMRELHRIIKESFQRSVEGFPDFYGNNLDALWDCLTGFIETPVEIVLIGANDVGQDLKEYVGMLIEVFEGVSKNEDWEITFTLR